MSSHTTSSHFILICNEILDLNKSIRFVGLANNLRHSIGTYDRLIRTTILIIKEENLPAKFFILLSFDIGADVKGIIENVLLPYTHKNIKLFS
ncbi:MAG: hypothetical protein WBL68_12870 [Nitrososphaeraceae archaeon]